MKHKIIQHIILPLIIVCVAWAPASCTSDPEPEELEYGEAMSFEVKTTDASRANVSNNSNLTEKPFIIFGDVVRTGVLHQGLQEIFKGDKITYSGGKWNYGTPIYWLMSQEHSFVAIHPAISPCMTNVKYSDSKVSFDYTIPTSTVEGKQYIDNNAISDILVATHRRKYNLDNSGAIRLEFKHLLARVNIEPALLDSLMYEDEQNKKDHPFNEDEFIQIKRIIIYGLKTKAFFSCKSTALADGEWQNDEKDLEYEVDDESLADAVLTFEDPVHVTNNNTYTNVCLDHDALLVLPQVIDESAKVVLYYTVNTDHREDPLIRKITFPFYGLPITEWEAGKVYSYRFSIDKAYTGQIKPGSVKWEINDRNIDDDNNKENWISGDETIRQEFNPERDDNSND